MIHASVQRHLLSTAAVRTELRGRMEPVGNDYPAAEPPGLVSELPPDFPEGGVLDALGKAASHQSFHVEGFHPDDGIVLGELSGHLVESVPADVGDPPVGAGYPMDGLSTVIASFFFAAH